MAARRVRSRSPSSTQRQALSAWEVAPQTKGWAVQRQGGDGVTSRHAWREPAVREAHQLAQRHRPDQVIVVSEDGERGWVVEYPDDPEEPSPTRRAGIALLEGSGRPPEGELEA